jgi:ribosomal protein S18 acetylase RimI-like enzyme
LGSVQDLHYCPLAIGRAGDFEQPRLMASRQLRNRRRAHQPRQSLGQIHRQRIAEVRRWFTPYHLTVQFEIRSGTAADADALLRLWREADAEPTHTDDVKSLAHLVAYDPAALLVAENDGRLVGSIIAGWDGWRGSIYRLVVAPDCRRRGLGRQLVGAAESRLRQAGATRAQAVVIETDEAAAWFWRASDWEEQTERLRFVKG